MSQRHGRTIKSTEISGTELEYIEEDPKIKERYETAWDEDELFDAIKTAAPLPTFWDIGSCIGVHSAFASKYYDQVYAFEPVTINTAAHRDMIRITQMSNIDLRNAALADQTGTQEIEIRESTLAGHGRHSLTPDDDGYDVLRTEEVDVYSADDLVRDDPSMIPNVVKIDVEGAEGLVLDGMEDILNDSRCVHVFVETHAPNPEQPSYEDFGYELGEIYDMLMGAGFTIEHLGKPYLVWGYK